MMATFYTKAQARNAALQAKLQTGRYGKSSARVLIQESLLSKDHEIFDVFLSHSSKDADLILGVKEILEKLGQKVYVDWVDDSQLDRTKVTPSTADLLRRRMRQSKSLIWVASEAASESKWMPWELGYFDGYKPKQVAVLPLVDNPTDTFRGQEYLALYPVVCHDRYRNGAADIFVESVGKEWTTLDKFLSGKAVYNQF